MKKIRKGVSLAIVGGLLLGGGILAGYNLKEKIQKPTHIEAIVKSNIPYIQTFFDKKIEEVYNIMGLSTDYYVAIRFIDDSKLEIHYNLLHSNSLLFSTTHEEDLIRKIKNKSIGYRIVEIGEREPNKKMTYKSEENLTSVERDFYRSIVRNLGIGYYNLKDF